MDYDDNDFQNQNFQLGAEENTKFPPGLRSYALPKFDLDDNLQVHLRFDSLVETEVLLGIQGQEENQWIEEFSRGNSGIEFSSGGAESCSISRRENVWSEAASSESVEMLLKSVGQDEMITGQTIIEGSDACDGLDNITNQMEPALNEDGSIPSNSGDAVDVGPTLPPKQCPESFAGLSKDVVAVQSQVEATPQSHKCEMSGYGSLKDLGPIMSGEKSDSPLAEGNLMIDEKCTDRNQREDGSLVVGSEENNPQDDSAVSETIQIDNLVPSIEELNATVTQQKPVEGSEQRTSFDNPDALQEDESVKEGEGDVSSKEDKLDDQNCDGNTVESTINKVENNSSSVKNIDFTVQLPVCSEHLCSEQTEQTVQTSNWEAMVLSKSSEVGDKIVDDTHDSSLILEKEIDSLEGDAAKVNNSNVGIPSKPVLNMGPLAQAMEGQTQIASSEKQDHLLESDGYQLESDGYQLECGISGCNSETSLLKVEDKKLLEINSNNHVENPSFLMAEVCSSTNIIHEKQTTEERGDDYNSLGVQGDDCNSKDHVSVSLQADSSQICNSSLDIEPCKMENASMSTVSGGTESVDDGSLVMEKHVVSLSHGQSTAEAEVGVCEPKSSLVVGEESGNGIATNEVIQDKEDIMPSVCVGDVAQLEGKEESVTETFTESNLVMKECSLVPSEPASISEVENLAVCDGTGEQLPGSSGQSSSSAGTVSTTFQNEPEAVLPDKITQAYSCELETQPVVDDPVPKEDDSTGVIGVSNEKCKESSLNSTDVGCGCSVSSATDSLYHGPDAGSTIPDSEERNCGSPTVISSTEVPQNEKEKGKGGNGSLDQNSPVSDHMDGQGNKVEPCTDDIKGNSATEDDRSFTFEVSAQEVDLSDRETDRGWRPFPSVQHYEFHQTVEGSPSTSSLGPIDPKLQGTNRGSHRASDGETPRASSKGTSDHKRRRASGKGTDKEASKEGKSLKDPLRQAKDRGGSSCSVSPTSCGTVGQVVQDLNTSASSSSFQQPFTDLQQVQLRAQIFVYGSLIQGTAPDEACMVAAFGESDGGRSLWDNVWRASLQRLHNQKHMHGNSETPLQSHPGSRFPEETSRQSSIQNKVIRTPTSRAGGKGAPSATINPVIPPSPLWSISTPSRDGMQPGSMPGSSLLDANQALSPLHHYQSPYVRHYVGNSSPWLSQAPAATPWVVSPAASVLDANALYSAFPITETGHVTTVREISVTHPSTMQHTPPSSLVHSGGSTSVPAGPPPLPEVKRAIVSPSKTASADPKPRKRKRSMASEESGHMSLVAQPQTESVSAVVVTNHLPTSVAITPSAAKTSTNSMLTNSPISATHFQIIGGQDMEQRVIFSEETCSKVEQAKQHAEDAAALAATAVGHSQSIWSQLAVQKISGLVSDVEAKLASAAVAVAAAASVARAAAAAAKVASDAALQAKLMADEALRSSRTRHPTQTIDTSLSDGVKNMGTVTPASILMGKDKTNSSSSVIVAAKEAARRRVEAASAATKRAENLDAVVKAAELAAEAVSQAGTIIAMGEPLPLTLGDLVEAGPNGYWKVQVSSEHIVKSSNLNEGGHSNVNGIGEGIENSSARLNEQSLNKQETQQATTSQEKSSSKELARLPVENNVGLVNGVQSSEKGLGKQKGRKTSNLGKTIGVVPESEIGSRTDSVPAQNEEHEGTQLAGSSKENSIKEGSVVEVLADKEGFRRVWFSAKVLSLKDGKAYVSYTEVLPDEGFGQLKEWVPLKGEVDKEPRLRVPHPTTAMKFEKTRKRRRAAIGDYSWSVGDRVDAWKLDGWWEGIISEWSKEDEMSFIVHFPAQGDTSVVKAWHLRPSLVWKDGQWIEWSRSREDQPRSNEADTPQEKRPKLGKHGAGTDSAVEVSGKDKVSKNMGVSDSGKPEAARLLALSDNEKIFTVGKSIKEGSNSDALTTKRIGLQKEGSRVIFGVPKPGKKRKFMEVSKHYVSDKSAQTTEVSDSMKFTKYLIRQGSGPRGWKNTNKVDSKGKRAAESKPKVIKSGRTGKNSSEKDSSSISTLSLSNDGRVHDHVKTSVGHHESIPERQNQLQPGSFPDNNKAAEGTTLFASLSLASDAPSYKKKSSATDSTLELKGKVAPSAEKLARNDEKDSGHYDNAGKSVPDVIEPRRSNRRIQPTSRLLEGLQSSYIISKIPAISHDKSTRAQHRGTQSSRGNNHS
ncbi:PREDICTED: uncharacterized protein LOC104602374 isoform X2 [Nelumbo nucifera]|uniref:Uncharacterized protein LOC104602374 isoform X2 n=1 Tax=Nelumbo nucifera TaxID=4432 RepID=A0A1U8ANG5_NELNU|nr:PREDICTED: uncharacterized protein LOC104602374 isoform X2 [Nelumbo nucifera]